MNSRVIATSHRLGSNAGNIYWLSNVNNFYIKSKRYSFDFLFIESYIKDILGASLCKSLFLFSNLSVKGKDVYVSCIFSDPDMYFNSLSVVNSLQPSLGNSLKSKSGNYLGEFLGSFSFLSLKRGNTVKFIKPSFGGLVPDVSFYNSFVKKKSRFNVSGRFNKLKLYYFTLTSVNPARINNSIRLSSRKFLNFSRSSNVSWIPSKSFLYLFNLNSIAFFKAKVVTNMRNLKLFDVFDTVYSSSVFRKSIDISWFTVLNYKVKYSFNLGKFNFNCLFVNFLKNFILKSSNFNLTFFVSYFLSLNSRAYSIVLSTKLILIYVNLITFLKMPFNINFSFVLKVLFMLTYLNFLGSTSCVKTFRYLCEFVYLLVWQILSTLNLADLVGGSSLFLKKVNVRVIDGTLIPLQSLYSYRSSYKDSFNSLNSFTINNNSEVSDIFSTSTKEVEVRMESIFIKDKGTKLYYTYYKYMRRKVYKKSVFLYSLYKYILCNLVKIKVLNYIKKILSYKKRYKSIKIQGKTVQKLIYKLELNYTKKIKYINNCLNSRELRLLKSRIYKPSNKSVYSKKKPNKYPSIIRKYVLNLRNKSFLIKNKSKNKEVCLKSNKSMVHGFLLLRNKILLRYLQRKELNLVGYKVLVWIHLLKTKLESELLRYMKTGYKIKFNILLKYNINTNLINEYILIRLRKKDKVKSILKDIKKNLLVNEKDMYKNTNKVKSITQPNVTLGLKKYFKTRGKDELIIRSKATPTKKPIRDILSLKLNITKSLVSNRIINEKVTTKSKSVSKFIKLKEGIKARVSKTRNQIRLKASLKKQTAKQEEKRQYMSRYWLNLGEMLSGYKIECKGMFVRKHSSRSQYHMIQRGAISLNKKKENIEYTKGKITLRTGSCNIRVWLLRKDGN